MKVQLVSHSSVIVECDDVRIWCDPWLVGRVFNDSWSLFPEPHFEPSMLESIDYLWISHEHPDHFNVPTLRGLPEAFKKRVTVLFQHNNSEKMFHAFEQFGFPNHQRLPHRKVVRISDRTEVYCYLCGQMDSCLGVRSGGDIVLNVNDAPVNRWDCNRMRADIGPPGVLLNQFSLAGYGGFEDREKHLRTMARDHLQILLENHRDAQAGYTLPFASFVVFAREDNAYMNGYANQPRDVHEYLRAHGADVAVLYPGDTLELGAAHDPRPALARFNEAYARLESFEYDKPETVELEEIIAATAALSAKLSDLYPKWIRRRLRPVTAELPDLETTVRFSLADGSCLELGPGEAPDMVVNSQPLLFALTNPYGVQTLGVSARFTLLRNLANWRNHRLLMAALNAEIYLRPKYFFTRDNLAFLYQRRRGLIRQIATRLAYMRSGR